MRARKKPLRKYRHHLLLALLAAAVFLSALGARDLWNPDEPRYAEVAREMRQSGDYLVPHLNGAVYDHKPPLFFWAINGFAALRGSVDAVAARLPSAWGALGSVLVVFLLGDRLFGRRVAWFSAAAFGTSFAILYQARVAQIDMLLVFIVALAMLFWVHGYLYSRPGFYWLFFAATGLATLTKGPVGLVPPLLSIIVFLLLTRQTAELKRMRIGRGLLLWAAIVLVWLIPAAISAGGDYLERITLEQTLERYFTRQPIEITKGHQHPWFYYLWALPVFYLPWSAFLPATVMVGRRLVGHARRHALFLLSWVVTTIIFFSLPASKRHVYVLTMLPGLSVLVGLALDRAFGPQAPHRRWYTAPLAVVALLAAAILPATTILLRARTDLLPPGVESIPALNPILTIGCLGAGLAWWAMQKGRVALSAGLLAGAAVVIVLGISLFVFPHFDSVKSPRQVAETLNELIPEGDEFATLGHCPICIYYTGRYARELANQDELRAYVATRDRVWIMVRKKDAAELDGVPVRILAGDGWPRSYVLLGSAQAELGR